MKRRHRSDQWPHLQRGSSPIHCHTYFMSFNAHQLLANTPTSNNMTPEQL